MSITSQATELTVRNRRVVVGVDERGRSVVLTDTRDMAQAHPPTGVTVEEVWRQEHVPAHLDDDGARPAPIGLEAPAAGAVVRVLTVPATSPDAPWNPDLHFDDSMHVITLISGRLDVVLEVGAVTLDVADTVVLPASVHDLRNTGEVPAVFVYTSFPLDRTGGDR